MTTPSRSPSLSPARLRANWHRRMAFACLRANSSAAVRLERYRAHIEQARALESQGCAMANLPVLSALPSHTSGPWSVESMRTRLAINSDCMMVAYLPFADATCQANAALIAAAPDLLEALVGMVEVFGDEYGGGLETVSAARAAIAKAGGVK